MEQERPLAWGESWDPVADPEGSATYLYAVLADSTLWIRLPSGRAFVMSAYVAKNVGQTAGERTGLDGATDDFVGYGLEGRRVYLYARQGVGVVTLLALLGLVALGTLATFVVLWRRLQAERLQRRQLVDARRRLNVAREDERLALARDLHDGPIQNLNVLHLRLGQFADLHPPPSAPAGDMVALTGAVHETIEELRSITARIRPPSLGPFGLAGALRTIAARLATSNPDIQVDLHLDEDGQALPDLLRVALFRIAQEAVANALKHGPPTRIVFRLHLTPNDVSVHVEDDGRGFDPSAAPPDGHYGILGMSERAAAVGARFSVESRPGGPTVVTVLAPLTLPT